MRLTLRTFVIATAALVSACGGSYQGDTATGGTGGGSGGGTTPSAVVASVKLVPNTTSLPANADGTSGGAAGIALTAIVLDANNNAVANAPVSWSTCTPNGTTACPGTTTRTAASGVPGAIVNARTTTDASGVAQATLTTGGNTQQGYLNVSVASGVLKDTVSISVVPATAGGASNAATAATLHISASSTQLASNANSAASGVTITAFVSDSSNNAVAGVPVTFSASGFAGKGAGQLIVQNGTSDASGQASAVLTTGGDPTPRCINIAVTVPKTSTTSTTNTLDCGTPAVPANSNGTGITVTSATAGAPTAAKVTLIASSPQLSSNASTSNNGITLTAQVKDANNNVVPGVAVSFATPDSAAITVNNGTTDASGQATATLTTGGDPTNRDVTVTATTGNGKTDTSVIKVVGSTLTVSGPSNAQNGIAGLYTAVLLDSGGAPIANKPITFAYSGSGTLNPASAVNTNASGQAQVSVTPNSSGQVQATGLGVSAVQDVTVSSNCLQFTAPAANTTVALNSGKSLTVNWKTGGCSGTPVTGSTLNFSSTRGTFTSSTATTNAAGDATVSIQAAQSGFATITASSPSGPSSSLQIEFVATVPSGVSLQASPATISTNQQSTITAVVLDANNNLVKNATVQFTLTDTTGGTLSAGSAITNSQGKAQVTYSASSSPSSANGVKIKADVTSVLLPSGSSSTVTGVSGNTTLTVGGAALHITLGTGNKLSAEGPPSGNTTYVMPWVVVVRDSAGNPAQNATVTLSVHAVSYSKGCSAYNTTAQSWVRTDCAGGAPISCTSEDLLTGNSSYDLNGVLDPGEDLNGDGILQPGGIVEVPGTVTLDANGTGTFEIRYPEDEAYWVKVRLRATATVSGTESINQTYFDLPGLASDFSSAGNAPPGVISPHGFLQDCAHEPTISFSKSAQGVASGATATANITLSTPIGQNPVTLPFTVSGTGTQGTDFTVTSPASCTTTSCSLTIPANGSAASISVLANPSAAGQTAVLKLGTPSSQAVVRSPSIQTIVLDGAAVTFTAGAATIDANGYTTITVQLDRAVASDVVVPYSCAGSTADVTLTPASPVTISAGTTSATIQAANHNASSSSNELVTCTLGTPSSGPAVLGTTSSIVLTLSHP